MELKPQNTEHRDVEEVEISLAEVVEFLRSNWKFLGLLVLGLSVITVTLVTLLLPHWQYEKQLTLSVRYVPSELEGEIERDPGLSIESLTPHDTGQLAAGYLENENFDQVEAQPTYQGDTQQVQVNLQSAGREPLDGITSKVVDSVEAGFQELYENILSAGAEAQLSRLERAIETNEEVAAQLEREIEQLYSNGKEDVNTAARLEGLETKRADLLVEVASDESERRNLEEAQEDISQLAAEPISVDVLSESDVQQKLSRLFVAVVVFAVMSSFIVAVIVTVIRAAGRRGK